jgi:selenocysteine lyase/cysteine desulfurase
MGEMLERDQVQLGVARLQGRWIVRFSPQIYNTEDEVRRGVRAVAGLSKN